jgi:hypothetical protein
VVPRAAPAPAALPQPPGRTILVSRKLGGGFPGGGSVTPSISSNGRYVAFASGAADLVAGDTNGAVDVFVRDRTKGTTIRLPLPGGVAMPTGGQAYEPSISADGSVVAFTLKFSVARPNTDLPPLVVTAILAWTRSTGKTELISPSMTPVLSVVGGPSAANYTSREPSVSGNGRYVAYTTDAPIDPVDRNGRDDVYRVDLQKIGSGETAHFAPAVLVSVGVKGGYAYGGSVQPAISDDGSKVAFTSDAGRTLVSRDTGSGLQVYLRDMTAGRTEQISAAQGGGPTSGTAEAPSISADGRYVAFESTAGNLVGFFDGGVSQVYRRDRQTGTTVLVSADPAGAPSKGGSGQAAISRDGRMVAFISGAADLVAGVPGVHLAAVALRTSEVYIRDTVASETALVSVSLAGAAAGARSLAPVVAGNGRFVAFYSNAPTLVTGDDNKALDVFVRDFPPVPVLRPAVVDFGAPEVGTAAVPGAAVLTNQGWGSLAVTGATIGGSAKGDYRILVNGCTKRTLHRSEACTITVGFTPKKTGSRPATLSVADGYTGSPRTARLTGRGSATVSPPPSLPPPPTVSPPPVSPPPALSPVLRLSSAVARPGAVVIVTGSGFPTGALVRLRWSRGISERLAVITVDASGAFRQQVLVFHNDVLGRRELLAEPAGGSPFPPVAAPLLVTESPMGPPAFGIMRLLLSLPLVMLFRG